MLVVTMVDDYTIRWICYSVEYSSAGGWVTEVYEMVGGHSTLTPSYYSYCRDTDTDTEIDIEKQNRSDFGNTHILFGQAFQSLNTQHASPTPTWRLNKIHPFTLDTLDTLHMHTLHKHTLDHDEAAWSHPSWEIYPRRMQSLPTRVHFGWPQNV